jgi:hypothetical protein
MSYTMSHQPVSINLPVTGEMKFKGMGWDEKGRSLLGNFASQPSV